MLSGPSAKEENYTSSLIDDDGGISVRDLEAQSH